LKLIEHYAAVLEKRRGNNRERARAFRRSVTWWVVSLAATGLALLLSFAVSSQLL